MKARTLAIIWAIVMLPIYFLIMLPIEYPLWQCYKEENYNVPGYLKFFWNRCVIFKDQNYVKLY